jgi:hypothetical protein
MELESQRKMIKFDTLRLGGYAHEKSLHGRGCLMKIYKTAAYVITESEPGYVLIDTIEYEGKFWLVPMWVEKPLEGWKAPERLVLTHLRQQEKNSIVITTG